MTKVENFCVKRGGESLAAMINSSEDRTVFTRSEFCNPGTVVGCILEKEILHAFCSMMEIFLCPCGVVCLDGISTSNTALSSRSSRLVVL